MRYSTNKDFQAFIAQLVATGWTFRRGKKHGRLKTPDGRKTLTISSSPSDSHALNNFRRDVAKAVQQTKQGWTQP
jgi:hypothetical protein